MKKLLKELLGCAIIITTIGTISIIFNAFIALIMYVFFLVEARNVKMLLVMSLISVVVTMVIWLLGIIIATFSK